jgi:SNF2 family DNA or RNA helicase
MQALKSYQIETRNFILAHNGAGVFLPPGLGKSRACLEALSIILTNTPTKKVLIIAPLRVMYLVWRQEIEKWGYNLSVGILHGNDKNKVLAENHDIYIINPEGLKWLFHCHRKKFEKESFMLVVDESTMFKNHSTERFRLMKQYLKLFERRVIMTGSPAPNGLIQLWPQIYILDGGKRLGSGITRFRAQYFMLTNPNSFQYELIPGMDKLIYEAIDDIVIHKSKDELNLPDLIYNNITVELPEPARKMYKQIKAYAVHELEGADERLVATTAAVKGLILKQIANGTVYNENRGVEFVHTEKLQALTELVNSLAGTPLLVVYEFNHDLARLKAELGDVPHIGGGVSAKELHRIMSDWNNGDLPVLLLQPAAAAHGINLQSGGCTDICWYSITFDLELYEQAIARIWRQGVSGSVTVHHIVAKGTVDEHVLDVLSKKGKVQAALLEALLK